jgi:hypothetical protein
VMRREQDFFDDVMLINREGNSRVSLRFGR